MGRPKDISIPLVEELPPTYDQAVSEPPEASSASNTATAPIPDAKSTQHKTTTLNPDLSEDANSLHRLIQIQARIAPRPCLSVNGSHKETRCNGKDKERTETITDFNFQVDLTKSVFRLKNADFVDPNGMKWYDVQIVSDSDGQKAFRGGRWKTREWRNRQVKRVYRDIEDGSGDDEGDGLMNPEESTEESSPGLLGWCERFCNDPAKVKSFTFNRTLEGFDISPLRGSLITHLRSLNYLGDICISLSLAQGSITVYSPHWVNRLRTNSFVWWFCVILQLWTLTWPVIWLLERRYEVVRSVWYTSHYGPGHGQASQKIYAMGRDEATLAEDWAPAITQAAWERRQGGCILTEEEVQRMRQVGLERMERNRNGAVVVSNPVIEGVIRGIGQVGGWDWARGWGRDN